MTFKKLIATLLWPKLWRPVSKYEMHIGVSNKPLDSPTHTKGRFSFTRGLLCRGRAEHYKRPTDPTSPTFPPVISLATHALSTTTIILSNLSTCLTTQTTSTSSRQTTQSTRTDSTVKRWRTAASGRCWGLWWSWSRSQRNALPPKLATLALKKSRTRATRCWSGKSARRWRRAQLVQPSSSTTKTTRATLCQWLLTISTYLCTSPGLTPAPSSGPPSPKLRLTSQRRTATPSARLQSNSTQSCRTAGCKLKLKVNTWKQSVSSVKPVFSLGFNNRLWC